LVVLLNWLLPDTKKIIFVAPPSEIACIPERMVKQYSGQHIDLKSLTAKKFIPVAGKAPGDCVLFNSPVTVYPLFTPPLS
jgi:hypothetical protein